VTGALGDGDAQVLEQTYPGQSETANAQILDQKTARQAEPTTSIQPPAITKPQVAPSKVTSSDPLSYNGINVGSQDCVRFWKELDVRIEETPYVPSGSETNFFRIGGKSEPITGGDIWLLTRRVSAQSDRYWGCAEFFGEYFLVLPENFNASPLLDNEYGSRLANSIQNIVATFWEKMILANGQIFHKPDLQAGRREFNGKALVVPKNAAWTRLTINPVLLEFQWEHTRLTQTKNIYRETLEQQRQARAAQQKLQARISEMRAQYDKFVNDGGVTNWPSIDDFISNPFVFQGQVIGVLTTFREMSGPDTGLFAIGGKPMVVSGIPLGTLKRPTVVLLAGSVIGKDQIDTPFGGKLMAPHLKFVQAHICQDDQCEDALFWQHPDIRRLH
jgi:hypothetical protein